MKNLFSHAWASSPARARGQLFSLDVVLAAVIFTLALAFVLNASELHVLDSQNRLPGIELHTAALLASDALVSKPSIQAQTTLPIPGATNLRCTPAEWAAHQDLSWVPNCLVVDPLQTYQLSSNALGIPSTYAFVIRVPGTPTISIPTGAVIPTGADFETIDRNVLVFNVNPSANTIQSCINTSAGCPTNIKTVSISVWRVI